MIVTGREIGRDSAIESARRVRCLPADRRLRVFVFATESSFAGDLFSCDLISDCSFEDFTSNYLFFPFAFEFV